MKRLAAILVALTASFATSADSATVVNFDNIDSRNHRRFSSYVESGMQFTSSSSVGFVSVGNRSNMYTGSSALLNNAANGVTTMTNMTGQVFKMQTITLSELRAKGGSSTITFNGQLQGGGTVQQSFTLDGTHGNEIFSFSSAFSGLTSLSWSQVSPYHQFDDITFVAGGLPIPSSGLLILTGLGATAMMRKRRRKTAL